MDRWKNVKALSIDIKKNESMHLVFEFILALPILFILLPLYWRTSYSPQIDIPVEETIFLWAKRKALRYIRTFSLFRSSRKLSDGRWKCKGFASFLFAFFFCNTLFGGGGRIYSLYLFVS